MKIKQFVQENRKIVCSIILFIAILFFLGEIILVSKNMYPSTYVEISELTPNGYMQEGSKYTNIYGDAHVQLPKLDQYVKDVLLIFSSPLSQPLNITVYYAEEDHGYSEEYTSYVNVEEGSTSAIIALEKYITTCRIDIGTQQEEIFELSQIILNEPVLQKVKLFRPVVLALFFVVVAAVGYGVICLSMRPEKLWFILVLSMGMFYLITITPQSAPDEPHHYHSSYQLSNALLLKFDEMEYGDSAYFDYSNFAGHRNVSSGYIRILRDFNETFRPGEVIPIPTPRGLSYFVEYLPQAIGIAIARITNQNFIRLFFLGRLCNLLFYSCCLYLAVKRTPIFKTMFGVVGIMPMSIHQAASYSYDGFVNGMSLVLIASILKAIYENDALSKKDFFYIVIVGALLGPAKVVYYPILMLTAFIPERRFGSRKRKLIGIAIIWGVGILLITGFQFSALFYTVSGEAQTIQNYEGGYNYTLSFIFEHLGQTIRIFWDTFQLSAIGWLQCAIGLGMSGLTLVIPEWIINCYIAVIFLSILNLEGSNYVLRPAVRGWLLLICSAVIVLTMLSMFLSWTSNFRLTIQGVQGRYFIPIVPLLALSVNNQTLVLKKDVDKILIMSALLLHGFTIANILRYTLLN